MIEIIKNCRLLDLQFTPSFITDLANSASLASNQAEMQLMERNTTLASFMRGIVPGTKWCGLGDTASDYTDVGPRALVDSCCRAHDHCPIRLKPFRSGYGLVNLSLYTKSHCLCDDLFLSCLKSTNSPMANMLGNLYFNVLKFGCIQESMNVSNRCQTSSPLGAFKTKRRLIAMPLIVSSQPMKRSPLVIGPSARLVTDPCAKPIPETSMQTSGRSGTELAVEFKAMEFAYNRNVRYWPLAWWLLFYVCLEDALKDYNKVTKLFMMK